MIITMLAEAATVRSVLQGECGILAGTKSEQVLIDMSTVSPDQARAIAVLATEAGIHVLDAPVFGSTGPAAAGTLGIMVGGPHGAVRKPARTSSARWVNMFSTWARQAAARW